MKTATETVTKVRYTVRKQTSGYNGDVRYYVYDTVSKGRVTAYPVNLRSTAQIHADRLNVADMVRPHAEDPRPYEERLAEATAAYKQLHPETEIA